MSGIAGLIDLRSAPADTAVLQAMTACMAYRGPDGSRIWSRGPVGLGHTLLRTTNDTAELAQPATLDGNAWIVADARIDARADLLRALRAGGRDVAPDSADAHLILHAYHLWDIDCVARLLGDFVFAIWDARRWRLLCARDHFGVKPFYHALVGGALVFGNTLNAIRAHPGVPDALNDQAVGDFLAFGFNQARDSTFFSAIQRLAPAHRLCWTASTGVRIARYWSLPEDGCVRYAHQADYVEHFDALLAQAVADRLRAPRVAVSMSGGLDSTALAALACERVRDTGAATRISAYTNVYERLIPDEEGRYAHLVAKALGIPLRREVSDDQELFCGWHAPGMALPEPLEDFGDAQDPGAVPQLLDGARVLLTGFGGDPALAAPAQHVADRLAALKFGRLARDVVTCLRTHGRFPPLGLRARALAWLRRGAPHQGYPRWIRPEFAARVGLAARWEALAKEQRSNHPERPEAHARLQDITWPYLFGCYDPDQSLLPIEVRYPFFDVRVVSYLLSMPAIPWFVNKALLREAMRGRLPECVRLRPKTPLARGPRHAVAGDFDRACAQRLLAAPGLAAFVDGERVPMEPWSRGALAAAEFSPHQRPLGLGYWLHYCWRRRCEPAAAEVLHGA